LVAAQNAPTIFIYQPYGAKAGYVLMIIFWVATLRSLVAEYQRFREHWQYAPQKQPPDYTVTITTNYSYHSNLHLHDYTVSQPTRSQSEHPPHESFKTYIIIF
jgi:hypothetical protein